MIKLHKLFVLFAAVAAFTACSNSEETNGTDDSLLANAPQTEVYMGVDVRGERAGWPEIYDIQR